MILIETNFLTNYKIVEKIPPKSISGRKINGRGVKSIRKVDVYLYEVKYMDNTFERFTGDDSLTLVVKKGFEDRIFGLIGQTYAKVVG